MPINPPRKVTTTEVVAARLSRNAATLWFIAGLISGFVLVLVAQGVQ